MSNPMYVFYITIQDSSSLFRNSRSTFGVAKAIYEPEIEISQINLFLSNCAKYLHQVSFKHGSVKYLD